MSNSLQKSVSLPVGGSDGAIGMVGDMDNVRALATFNGDIVAVKRFDYTIDFASISADGRVSESLAEVYTYLLAHAGKPFDVRVVTVNALAGAFFSWNNFGSFTLYANSLDSTNNLVSNTYHLYVTIFDPK